MTFTEGPLHERNEAVEDPGAGGGRGRRPGQWPGSRAGRSRCRARPVLDRFAPGYASRFAPDAIIAGIAGLVILVVGLIAIVRGWLRQRHEGCGGGCRLHAHHHSRLDRDRHRPRIAAQRCHPFAKRRDLLGTVLGVAGFVGAVQTESFTDSLALESSMAWIAVVVGLVVVLAALVLPRYARQSTVVANV